MSKCSFLSTAKQQRIQFSGRLISPAALLTCKPAPKITGRSIKQEAALCLICKRAFLFQHGTKPSCQCAVIVQLTSPIKGQIAFEPFKIREGPWQQPFVERIFMKRTQRALQFSEPVLFQCLPHLHHRRKMQVKRPAGDRKLRTELLDRRQDAILCQCIVDGLQDPLSGLGGTRYVFAITIRILSAVIIADPCGKRNARRSTTKNEKNCCFFLKMRYNRHADNGMPT